MATNEMTLALMDDPQSQSSTEEEHTPPPQTSGFFSLSAEIRNIIYSGVVEHDNDVWITASSEGANGQDTYLALATPPAIAQVCRLTRAEALPIFFGNNTFSITLVREGNVTRAKHWAAAIGDAAVKSIRRIRLSGHKGLGISGDHSAPGIGLELEKAQDGSIGVEQCYVEDPRWRSFGGTVEKVQSCLRTTAVDLKPLSRVEDLVAVVETFASGLYFREDAVGNGKSKKPRYARETVSK